MIITKIRGGLGNQLFQYAAGRALAHHHKTELFLDTSEYSSNWIRNLSLHNFNIQASNVPAQDAFNLENVEKIFPPINIQYDNETGYDEKFFSFQDNSYLKGYWQSEKYFLSIATQIRSELLLKERLSTISENLLDKIISLNSVALHVRRGDYVSMKHYNNTIGQCSLEYYHKSIAKICENVSDPVFFIFSDDPNWCKENLKIPAKKVFVEHNYSWKHTELENFRLYRALIRLLNIKKMNIDRSYEDLFLMSKCKYFITANSTFSWWGAWLSEYERKVICTPEHWYRKPNKNGDRTPKGLIPDSWIKL